MIIFRRYLLLVFLGYFAFSRVSTSRISNLYVLFGGIGPSDGIQGSVNDHDVHDAWLFNRQTNRWSRIGDYTCLESIEKCDDEITVGTQFANYEDLTR